MEDKKKRLVIIDSNSLVHRSFHALPPLTTKKGELVNAIYGFLLVFFKALREFQPDFIITCFDLPGPTFRHQQFEAYKATRIKAPEELYQQLPKLKEILRIFKVPIFEKEGFEADDLIGTIARLAPEIEIIIVSGDLDVLQLVNKNTKVYTLKTGVKETVLYDKERVREKYGGLEPHQLPDFKALKGDPSDNIPGVPGIGEKTAIELIKGFGNIENLYKEIEESLFEKKIPKYSGRILEILKKYRDQAFLSKTLATVKKDVPLDFNLKKCRLGGYDKKRVAQLLKNLGFHSLLQRLP